MAQGCMMNAKPKATSSRFNLELLSLKQDNPKGMPLITTNEFTPAEVKEIAAKALCRIQEIILDGSYQESEKSVENSV